MYSFREKPRKIELKLSKLNATSKHPLITPKLELGNLNVSNLDTHRRHIDAQESYIKTTEKS